MTAIQESTDRSLLARLVARLGPYVQDDTLRVTRLRGVLATVPLSAEQRAELQGQLIAAMGLAGIALVDDGCRSVPQVQESSLVSPDPEPGPEFVRYQRGHLSSAKVNSPSRELRALPAVGRSHQRDRASDKSLPLDEAAEVGVKPLGSDEPTHEAFEKLDEAVDTASAATAARQLLRLRRSLRAPSRRILSAEEEVGLAVLMRTDGRDLAEDLPDGWRLTLSAGAEAGSAHDALIEHNVRLVWSIAQRYQGQGLDLEDIVGYGHLGLFRAVHKFDPTKGFKFSTYATWWVRQAITRGIMDFGRTVRIPVHMAEKINRTRAAYSRLEERGQRPTINRVSKETGFDVAEIRQHLDWMRSVYSFDMPIGDDGSTLRDLLADRSDDTDSLSGVEQRLVRSEIDAVLGTLAPREERLVRLRYGLVDGETATLDEIGREFGLTRERIRQIESQTLAKLRHPNRSVVLRDYFDGPVQQVSGS